MNGSNTFKAWIDVGYMLFAQDGLECLQIERLARILQLNKSGFYHYFGSRENYLMQLMDHHAAVTEELVKEISYIRKFDPEYPQLLIKYSSHVLVHMQLVRNRHFPLCNESYKNANKLIDVALLPAWAEFIGAPKNTELALRYFEMIRDIFYSRITSKNMNEEFLRNLFQDSREFIAELMLENSYAKSA